MVDLSTAARILGISRQAVAQHGERGNFEILRAGSARLVHLNDIQRMLLRDHEEDDRRRKEAKRIVLGLSSLYATKTAQTAAVMSEFRLALERRMPKGERRQLLKKRNDQIKELDRRFTDAISRLEKAREATFGR